jgi:hypothetical protein
MVARGESEANTPGYESTKILCRVSGIGTCRDSPVPLTRHNSWLPHDTRGVRFAFTPGYLPMPLRGDRTAPYRTVNCALASKGSLP